jgi:hypothetical protein
MRTKLPALVGGAAVVASTLVVLSTSNPGQAVAGSGNGATNTQFVQPTVTAMSFGATVTAAPATTVLQTSVASPTAKASALASECTPTGQCP